MAVPYINGGESPTAALMNTLFIDGLESKFVQILHGKSFYLATNTNTGIPHRCQGQTFFFTSGYAAYASNAKRFVDIGGGGTRVARPYDHTQFTDAVAAIDLGTVTWDEVNKIADIPAFDNSLFDGLTTGDDTSLLSYSLQAHYLMHQGASDAAPVPYYIRETKGVNRLTPERRHKYAVAEIIIEGPSAITIEATWDKYSCFRIHNLNHFAATVHFGSSYVLTLEPLECQTVRRDSTTSNYRLGGHYFWHFEHGDPRFFMTIAKDGFDEAPGIPSPAVTNSIAANNLTNQSILYDWIYAFVTPFPQADGHSYFAAFRLDQDIYNTYPDYSPLFGDPSNGATIFGDLLHHLGEIMIVRSSKTLGDPFTNLPVLTFDSVTFNGYATIVADFAAKQLAVAEDANGDYVITSTDPANNVYLVPISTNLFKRNTSREMVIDLSGSNSFTIENAVFEGSGSFIDGNLGAFEEPTATPPQSILHPSTITIPDSRTYLTDPLSDPLLETTVDGDDIIEQDWTTPRPTAITLHGVHRYTVADILSMPFWGDPAVADQNSTYVAISERSLRLTPEGLILRYTHTKTYTEVFGDPSVDLLANTTWFGEGHGSIQFRAGSGWGFGAYSGYNAAYLSPRLDRRQIDEPIAGETFASAGADFSLKAYQRSLVSARILTQLNATTAFILPDYAGFIFKFYNPGDYLIGFLKQKDELTPSQFGEVFYNAAQSGNWAGYFGSDPDQQEMKMRRTHEMYNGMAQLVNSITQGFPLSADSLAFVVGTEILSLGAALTGVHPSANGTNSAAVSWVDSGAWDADTNNPDIAALADEGQMWTVTVDGATNVGGFTSWEVGDIAVYYEGEWHQIKPEDDIVRLEEWHPSSGGGGFGGPLPIDCMCIFEAGSKIQQLAEQLGVVISDASDFPGGPDGTFADYANKHAQRAVFYDRDDTAEDGDADGITDASSFSELLDIDDLEAGLATGTDCFDNWDGDLGNMPGLFTWYPDVPGESSKWWSDARENGFYVISEDSKFSIGSTSVSAANPGTGYAPGDIITLVGGSGRAAQLLVRTVDGGGGVTSLPVSDPGWYDIAPGPGITVTGGSGTGLVIDDPVFYQQYEKGDCVVIQTSAIGGGPKGFVGERINYRVLNPRGALLAWSGGSDNFQLTGLDHLRWFSISSFTAAMNALGFPFFWKEVFTPIVLEYFDEAWTLSGASIGPVSVAVTPGAAAVTVINISALEDYRWDDRAVHFRVATSEDAEDVRWKIRRQTSTLTTGVDVFYRKPWSGSSPMIRARNFNNPLEVIMQATDSGGGDYHRFLEFIWDEETELTDQRSVLVLQQYLDGRTSGERVMLIGNRQWVKQSDWWSSNAELRALAAFGASAVPWIFQTPRANTIRSLTDTPLNYIETASDERYAAFIGIGPSPLIELP